MSIVGGARAGVTPPAAFRGGPWEQAASAAVSHAPYLKRLIERRADLCVDIGADWPALLVSQAMAQAAAIARDPPEMEEAMQVLRRAKQSLHLAVAIADLARAWPLSRITGALSDFADASLRAALALL